jgi:DNA-binding GntR family transcriptional regulator
LPCSIVVLRDEIQSGELLEGDLPASEYELARICPVSRATGRQTVPRLKAPDHVVGKRGHGMFLIRPKVEG